MWSAVENFAGPLGLVRPEMPNRLDSSGSSFYQAIRKRVEERGSAGIEVRTVDDWFTGYNAEDGKESPGLTRRLVDIYLLCLAQQGVIRISYGKHGQWIDRATIGAIDFKPETLRSLGRIELPRPLDDWPLFSPCAANGCPSRAASLWQLPEIAGRCRPATGRQNPQRIPDRHQRRHHHRTSRRADPVGPGQGRPQETGQGPETHPGQQTRQAPPPGILRTPHHHPLGKIRHRNPPYRIPRLPEPKLARWTVQPDRLTAGSAGDKRHDSRPGVFNLSHSSLISKFLAWPFPFHDRLP